jgi:hypothetical protein
MANSDLKIRTKDYALSVIQLFAELPKLDGIKKETGELKGIFVSIVVNTKAKSKNPKL